MRTILPITIVVVCVSGSRADGPLPAIVNAGFEAVAPGGSLTGWQMRPLSQSHGYKVEVARDKAHSGLGCLKITQAAPTAFGHIGLVSQRVSAENLRGKRIRFRAAVRAQVEGSGRNYAALWARAVRPGGLPCPFVDMADQPIRSSTWVVSEVVMDVTHDATEVELGFILSATGQSWFDSAELAVIGTAGDGNEPPRALEGRGLENLIALARLLGYVRYFHPSDEVAAADWERLAIDSVGVVEPARSSGELAERLNEIFLPLAPLIQVFETSRPVDAAPTASSESKELRHVAWQHHGVSCNGNLGFYRSDRVTDRALSGGRALPVSKEPFEQQAKPFEADLGGGVSCRIPLVLLANAQGTLPRGSAVKRKSSKPDNYPPSGNDRATRLADVVLIWNVFQHFYPYFDCVAVDWPAALAQALTAAAMDGDAAAFHDTLRRLSAGLGDSHGFVRGGSGTLAIDGALPLAWDWVEGQLVVTDVEADAKARGIKPGDVVVSIEGRPAALRVSDAERLVCAATPQFRRYRALQDLRNGPAGTALCLELETPGGEAIRAVTIDRVAADDTPLRGPSMRERRLAAVSDLEPGILYVDLDRLNDSEMLALLPRLEKAAGIVFDLRGYPSAAMDIDMLRRLSDRPLKSDLWIVPVTRFPDRTSVTESANQWSLPQQEPKFPAKTVFLTDARAVSAAETVLSIVANHHLAPIVGGPTAGSNGSVNVYVVPGGYRVSWTGMKTLRQDGSRFHGVGVLPTAPVERTIKGLAAGRDEVLEKALSLVRG